jgi:hypothetical protein
MTNTETLPTPSAANVIDVYRSATPDQLAAGLGWYADARRIADAFAVKYGVTREQAAGVIAALSPLNSWGANINLAGRFLEAGGLHAGYLGKMLAKGRAILGGTEPLDVLTSDKIRNFYLCIISAGQTEAVCVDRHAYSIAVAERTVNVPSLGKRRYAALAATYTEAALELGVTAAQVQAVTWVAWRARYWNEGAFDGHEEI